MPIFQTPDPNALRSEARTLFDEISIPTLTSAPPQVLQDLRAMFAEGFLYGWSKGALQTLEQLLPEAPDDLSALLPEPPKES